MKRLKITVEGKVYDVTVEPLKGKASAPTGAAEASSSQDTQTPPPSACGTGSGVPSPLAGKVVSIDIAQGQRVSEGEQLMVLEAMKMNTYIYAPRAGTIAKIHISEGDSVEEGQDLIHIA